MAQLTTIVDAAGGSSGVSATILPYTNGNPTGVAQTSISSAGTVLIQGRLTDSHDWITLATVTSSEIAEIVLCAQMRATWSGNTGTVSVTLQE